MLDLAGVQVRRGAAADVVQRDQELGVLAVLVRAVQDLQGLAAEGAPQLVWPKSHDCAGYHYRRA